MLLAGATAVAACDVGPKVSDRPRPYTALRYEATVRQQQEFTCGAASVATILSFYWHRPTTEAMVLDTLRARYTDEQIAHISENGLSFDDLVFAVRALGLSAEGAKVQTDQLARLDGPVIVHLNKGSFEHFVVLRRVGDGVYYISDPVVGQLTMQAAEFKAQYTGDALAIWKSGAELPRHSILTSPRDGINVSNALRKAINGPNVFYQPGF